MNITPKSPQLIQAQLGEFRTTADLDLDQKRAIATMAGELLVQDDAGDLIHEHEGKKLQWNQQGKPYYEKWPVTTVVTQQQYLDFMRGMKPATRERLKSHHEVMLNAFDEYKEDVDKLIGEVNSLEDYTSHPQYLGKGLNGAAFWFDHDGEYFVVKRAHGHKRGEYRPGASHGESMPFAIGNQIEGLQHQVAASKDNELVVTELLPGKNLINLSYQELHAIPDEQIKKVIDLVLEMNDAGLHFDPKPTNLMYDTEKGFSILDYGINASKTAGEASPDMLMEWLVADVAPNINSTLKYDVSQRFDNEHNIQARLESQRNGMNLQKRFLNILEKVHPEIIVAAAKRQREIDEDPMRTGSVFVDTGYLLVNLDPELEEWRGHLLGLGLTSRSKTEKHFGGDDIEMQEANLVFD